MPLFLLCLCFVNTAFRADVTIYFCEKCATDYVPQARHKINFGHPQWLNITTLKYKRETQKYVLSTPKKARFVALARKGFVNLVEVEIYQYPCEYMLQYKFILKP